MQKHKYSKEISNLNQKIITSHPTKKFPKIDTNTMIAIDALDSRFLSTSDHAATSGCARINCGIQNMNDHHAVNAQAQTAIVSTVIRSASPRNNSATDGCFIAAAFARCHSSGSGTARRIQ